MLSIALGFLAIWTPAVQAQEGDADRMRLSVHSERLWRTSDASVDPGTGLALTVAGQSLLRPGVYIDPLTGEQTELLSSAAGPMLAAAVYHERLRMGLFLPMYTASQTAAGSQSFVPGEARLGMRGVLLPGGDERFGVALLGELVWPLSDASTLLSPPAMGLGGGLAVDYHLGPTLWALNATVHYSEGSELGVPLSSYAAFDAGVAWALTDRVDLSAEVSTDSQLDRFLGLGQGTAVEVTGGLRVLVLPDLSLRLAAGKGLSDGMGAPDRRLLAGLSWAPPGKVRDIDLDGVLDAADQCPELAEDLDGFQDKDGCPESDNDQDGIVDVADDCPLEPEDPDGWRDGDGCPEWDRPVALRLVDWAGRPLEVDQLDLRPLGAGDPLYLNNVSVLDSRLDHGAWELRAIDHGQQTLITRFEVPEGEEPLEILLELRPEGPVAQARLVVKDDQGAPIDRYTVLLDDNPFPIEGEQGEPLLLLSPGAHTLVVSAPDRNPTTLQLELSGGQQTAVYATLQPELVKVSANYIELARPIRFAGSTPDPEAEQVLKQLAELMRAHPELEYVRLEVHVADSGDPSADQALSQKQADALVRTLVQLGVPRRRLEGVGFGSTFPISDDPLQNQRVMVFVEEMDG